MTAHQAQTKVWKLRQIGGAGPSEVALLRSPLAVMADGHV